MKNKAITHLLSKSRGQKHPDFILEAYKRFTDSVGCCVMECEPEGINLSLEANFKSPCTFLD